MFPTRFLVFSAVLMMLVQFSSTKTCGPCAKSRKQKGFRVEKWNEVLDGVLDFDNVARKIRRRGFVVKTWIMPAGARYPLHPHTFDEIETFITGAYRFSMNGKEVVMKPGDLVHVPAYTCHDTSVVGNETIIFLQGRRKAGNVTLHPWDEATREAPSYSRLISELQHLGYIHAKGFLLKPGQHLTKPSPVPTVLACASSYLQLRINGERFVLYAGDIVEIPPRVKFVATPYYGEPSLIIRAEKPDQLVAQRMLSHP